LTHDLLTPVVRKHRDRQREEERRQREKESKRRQRRWLAFLSAIGLGAFVLALVMFGLYRDARDAANLAEQRLAAGAFREATLRASEGDNRRALAYLAQALRSSAGHTGARALALDILLNRRWEEAVMAHQEPVLALAWSPDGTRLLTGSGDNTARVWDARTGQPVGAPLEHQGWVLAVAWSPDGTRLLTGSADSTARVWDAPIIMPSEAARAADVAELIGGLRVSDDDAVVSVDELPTRLARREELKRDVMSRSAEAGSFDSLLQWFFRDPRERTISPLSTMSVDEYVARMLARGEEGRAEVARTYPGHPRLREPEAGGGSATTGTQPR
jgi:hypothetical protein